MLGVSGGIAAYKSAELIRLLKKRQIEVKVVMTASAQAFITPLSLATLSQQPVYTKLFDQQASIDPCIDHIELARWADCIVIAPASANIISKLSHGNADDLLSTLCLATTVPIHLAPAMNQAMWAKPIVQKNINNLKANHVNILAPTADKQACGETGIGCMLEPSDIVENLLKNKSHLQNKTVMITAGPTVEAIDPVRFISNHSSGKMGYAIAEASAQYGAKVIIISGPSQLKATAGINHIAVTTAQEMFDKVMQHIRDCDIFIAAAAVADYRPAKVASKKIKRHTNNQLNLELVANPDILASVAALKNPPLTVGFAAETDQLLENAKAKLKQKKVDMIAANIISNEKGFYCDDNEISLISKNGKVTELGKKSKKQLAQELIEFICQYHCVK